MPLLIGFSDSLWSYFLIDSGADKEKQTTIDLLKVIDKSRHQMTVFARKFAT